MQEQDFEFAEAVNRVAAYLSPKPDQADILGNLQGDYRTELYLAAKSASHSFQKKYGDDSDEKLRYVLKALWNYARVRVRSRYRRNRFFLRSVNGELDPIDLASQMEARSSIHALQKNLDKNSLKVLIALAEADGDVTKAWNDDPRYHRRYFSVKVQRAREAGRRVLQN